MLGERQWHLLLAYGRLMDGPHSGHYLSALPPEEQLALARALVEGNILAIDLMHRHRCGDYETLWLRYVDGKLMMVFEDRVQRAQPLAETMPTYLASSRAADVW